MDELRQAILPLIPEEITRAEKHEKVFADRFHAAAVLMAEFDEIRVEFNAVQSGVKEQWEAAKRKADHPENLERTKDAAIRLACEAVQVAAMCEKAMIVV